MACKLANASTQHRVSTLCYAVVSHSPHPTQLTETTAQGVDTAHAIAELQLKSRWNANDKSLINHSLFRFKVSQSEGQVSPVQVQVNYVHIQLITVFVGQLFQGMVNQPASQHLLHSSGWPNQIIPPFVKLTNDIYGFAIKLAIYHTSPSKG